MGSTVWCLSCLFAVLPECIRSFTWWAFWSLLGGNPSFHGVVAIMFSNNDCVVVEKSIFRSLSFSVCVCVLQQRFHAYKSWTLQSYCLFQITKQGTGGSQQCWKKQPNWNPNNWGLSYLKVISCMALAPFSRKSSTVSATASPTKPTIWPLGWEVTKLKKPWKKRNRNLGYVGRWSTLRVKGLTSPGLSLSLSLYLASSSASFIKPATPRLSELSFSWSKTGGLLLGDTSKVRKTSEKWCK